MFYHALKLNKQQFREYLNSKLILKNLKKLQIIYIACIIKFQMRLEEIFFKFKQEKCVDPENLARIKQILTDTKSPSLRIWQLKPILNYMLKFGKFQAYFLLIGGLTAIPFACYHKYQEDQKKLIKLAVACTFGVVAVCAPILLYKIFTRGMLRSINYNAEQHIFEIIRLNSKQVYNIKPKNIEVMLNDKKRVKQVNFNEQNIENGKRTIHNIQGIGEWDSLQLFNHILEWKEKENIF